MRELTVLGGNSMMNIGFSGFERTCRAIAFVLVLAVLVLANSVSAAEPVGPGLSGKLRGLLVEEMLAIEAAMQVTYSAIIQGDHAMVAQQGRAIHDSFILAQALTAEDRKALKAAVPLEFLQMDKRLHQLAASLAEAAEEKDSAEQVKLFGRMTESCVACHSSYVSDRFNGLQNQRLPQSWGQAEPIGDSAQAFEATGDRFFKIEPVRPVVLLEAEALQASPPEEEGDFESSDLVDVTAYGDTIKLDVRYAGSNNFLGTPVYSSAQAFLQRPAAQALGLIAEQLQAQGYGLLVHDAYRPWYVTKIFWDATPESGKKFVADPAKGSRHNRGAAVDLTLYDLASGAAIEMPGLYDEMSERSYPGYPGGSELQRQHRDLLRSAMEANGFTVYEYEWWHFDFQGWQQYRVQNDTFEQLNTVDR